MLDTKQAQTNVKILQTYTILADFGVPVGFLATDDFANYPD